MTQSICWFDGQILPTRQASIPLLDHGLLYGDGVFEGIRFYHNQPFLLDEHLTRLFDSSRAIALDCPWQRTTLEKIIAEVIEAFPADEGYLRILLTRGVGALGIDPRSCSKPNLAIIAASLELVDREAREKGAEVIVAATRRLPADGLDPRIKSLNYLNAILARIEANHAGADEAVLLNQAGHVTEGSADNVFITKNGLLLTPPTSDGALAGITRELILRLAAEEDIPAREQTLTAYDLYTADECFLTGTGAELIPVRRIDGRAVQHCPGPTYRQLEHAFQRHIDSSCKRTGQ